MCIICVSKSGVRQPGEATIRAMFLNNPHGAGYMVARGGRVEIHKGFMRLDEYLRAIRAECFTPQDSVVYHFRISTQAGVNPEMTHPFPLSNQPARLRRLDPVSYTHLIPREGGEVCHCQHAHRLQRGCQPLPFLFGLGQKPVSYTHLDVYKRQPSRPPRFPAMERSWHGEPNVTTSTGSSPAPDRRWISP